MVVTNPTPQRALRAHRPQRPVLRRLNGADHHAWLARHLTPRDRWLVRMLYEHKVFTTDQIIDLAFPSRRAANLRLRNLHQWGVLHRFQPHRASGSHPMHYVLDSAGATLLAHEDGLEPSVLHYNRDREIGRAYSLQLAHTIGCNGLFTTLIRRARESDATGELTAWWSAGRCARLWGDIITPDGYGRWCEVGRNVEWFLEFDFGTEQLARLATKITRYDRLAQTTGITTPILFWLPTARREAGARHVLLEALRALDRPDRTPIATTSGETVPDSVDLAQARWRRVDGTQPAGRVRLAELPTLWPHLPPSAPLTATTTRLVRSDARPKVAPPHPMPPPNPDYRRR